MLDLTAEQVCSILKLMFALVLQSWLFFFVNLNLGLLSDQTYYENYL